eukprot:TRINITY_DN1900_c0_g1_i1.p1 TRINITY_DN1900_c0_g1~~TRINITY_DN1900_c0_g1_i1.p1  ORF type:complete len:347 (-),score=39.05 TRINITY_DN1900_c0_g1_i1:790-1806(-)
MATPAAEFSESQDGSAYGYYANDQYGGDENAYATYASDQQYYGSYTDPAYGAEQASPYGVYVPATDYPATAPYTQPTPEMLDFAPSTATGMTSAPQPIGAAAPMPEFGHFSPTGPTTTPSPFLDIPFPRKQYEEPTNDSKDFYHTTRTWVSSKGYGWLMELEDDEDDDSKPLLEELEIDPMEIVLKIKAILLPYSLQPGDVTKLNEADFWGPFFIVLTYAFLVLWGQLKAVSWVFTLWIAGSFFVYLLLRVMGAETAYSEVLAVVGYSLIPLVMLCMGLPLLRAFASLAFALKVVHTAWCAYCAKTLLIPPALRHKQFLIAYPILLLYVYFISLHSGV